MTITNFILFINACVQLGLTLSRLACQLQSYLALRRWRRQMLRARRYRGRG